jgi:hypothetical protein
VRLKLGVLGLHKVTMTMTMMMTSGHLYKEAATHLTQ